MDLGWAWRRRRQWLAGLVVALVAGLAMAETPRADDREARARQVEALVAGASSSSTDARQLFRLSLREPPSDAVPALLRLVEDPAALKAAQAARAAGRPLPLGVDDLVLAQAAFLSLPPEVRSARLGLKADDASNAVQPGDDVLLKAMRADIATLRRLLGPQASPDGAPATALTIDALDPDEVVLNAARRRAWLAAYDGARAQASEASEKALTDARTDLDTLRARALATGQLTLGDPALPPGAQAQADHAAALAAAANARTETTRLVETERARLLAIRQAQTRFEVQVAAEAATVAAEREAALAWRRRVNDQAARSLLDPAREADADQLYADLVDSLRDVRARLWSALAEVIAPTARPPAPPPADPALEAAGDDAKSLQALRRSLSDEADRLRDAGADADWDRAAALREAMGVMNDARLDLIPHLSGAARARVLGFGRDGLAQARRELDQVALEAQFNMLLAPRVIAGLADAARGAAAGAVIVGLQILVAGLLFRTWRRQGGRLVHAMQLSLQRRRPPTLATRSAARALGYVRAAQRPLDWLLLLILLAWAVPEGLRFPGAQYVWIAAVWALGAAAAVRLADEAWTRQRGDAYSEQRRRTVRLIAWTTGTLGLVLTLARVIVGPGALHHWAIVTSWVALLPGAVVLLHWWRPRIRALATAGAEHSAVLAWAARSHSGPLDLLALGAAATLILVRDLRAALVRASRQIALLRDMFDDRQRRRGAAAVRADLESGRYEPLPASADAALSAHRGPADLDRATMTPAETGLGPEEVVAIVGDCGLGKTTRLAQLAAGAKADVVLLTAEPSWAATLRKLARQIGARSEGREAVARALGRRGGVILLDDAHLLIGQGIGGARDFHSMIAFAHETACAWVFAVDGHAWDYISRLNDGRVLADRVERLTGWSDTAIGDLIVRRTDQAGLMPQFEGLDMAATRLADATLDREGRARAAYFERLTDYAGGNPAVALDLWRRSLRIEAATGRTVVRMFPTPPVEDLEVLPADMQFVLAALIRLDRADAPALVRATSLSAGVVSDALRRLHALDALEPFGDQVRVRLFWRREAVRMLQRRNLLSRHAA